MSLFTLYLLFSLLPNLRQLAEGQLWIVVILGVIFGGGMCLAGEAERDMPDTIRRWALRVVKVALSLGVFLVMLLTIVPKENQLYLIAGGYAVTNNTELKKLPDNVLHAANSYLERMNKNLDAKPDDKPAEKAK